ncbi:MFS general substrate transporter [Apiospora kogelbergensis]|uniref:MFS general substrate transporter n=1 Tax=Apiospora kogelbergensis TaxID=1337665 RepID=A0AAW0R537_9PEZI
MANSLDRPSITADGDFSKSGAQHVDEALSKSVEDYAIATPESLRDMTDDDLQKLETKMVRKVDFVILPIITVLYILNFVDRSALAASKVYGITKDLNMSERDFATAISILFVGYIPFQIPSNLIITKVSRPGLYICSAALIWGCVSAATAAVQTYQSLLAVRVFLGVTEAVFFPGVIYFLSAWYTKNELGKRLAGLFIAQQLGSAFGGFVAAACLTLDGRHGIAGWRWLFIVLNVLGGNSEGVVTVGCGILFALVMPEYPHNARLLSPVERDYAVWRLEKEAGVGEAHEDTSTRQGFVLALKDPKIWALVWCMFMTQAIGSSGNFFPSIVQTLGYGKNQTLLLTAPPYLFAVLVFIGASWASDRYNSIYSMIVGSLGVGVIAFSISLATLNTGARYFAMMLMPTAVALPQIMMYKTLNLHMARPYPKRSAGTAMINSLGGLSNIWASYLWYAPPHYNAAFGCLLGCVAVFFLTITTYRWHVRSLNKLLDGTPEQQRKAMKSGVTQQQIDLGWRYIGY